MSEARYIVAMLNVRSSRIAENISDSIDRRDMFTHVSDADPRNIASQGLTLLSLYVSPHEDPETYVCIVRKTNRVATAQARIKGIKVLSLKGFTLKKLVKALPKNFREKAKSYLELDYHQFSPKMGEAVFNTLLELQPDIAAKINDLFEHLYRKSTSESNAREQDAAMEKDALGLSLDIFGVDRADVFKRWRMNGVDLGESFLSGLKEFTVYEDDVLAHDLHAFPGFEMISEQDITGVVEFESQDGERLMVINANRKPLEKALGIDLIYFHRRYKSFVMVQYKMMDLRSEEHESFYYNPNQLSHERELERLQGLRDLINNETISQSLDNYRLSNSNLFFKLCKKIELKKADHTLAPGMYISLEQWEHLLKDTSTLGKKGGRQFGYHTLKKRYLHKDTFVNLVRAGMIGTAGDTSKKIGAFIEDAIAKGHSVMYAIDERLREPLSQKQSIKRRNLEDDLFRKTNSDIDFEDDDLPF